ncbi:UPF0280 family protein [Desulfofundulus sp. TPOSR]|uniref:ApbE family lipoprotein n=1 Tax=Desulfofundulus kuznetsovii (strain DSM 6115 / VKM B-1805 / 17) TaxID=760568 RepID=A0AAU8PB57_DESK7|nr:UPF0280 family protein [Desulfofundulus sp. TPOSR]AEG15225.1 ApbE family lipoprotein [Desulfofundulus kuznetsovii DSM 6115]NHM28326.1 UPF0280 family protein [Desulfofundulus sp. TPOSR]
MERTYRYRHRQEDLVHFQVVVGETDLDIGVRRERFSPELVERVTQMVRECRAPLEEYIKRDPAFLKAHTPYDIPPDAPPIVREMAEAARLAGVGPMAAVAGAIAERVGRALARFSRDVIVENGGDIYLRSARIRRIGVYAGNSPFSHRLALEVRPQDTPLGICTSSGTVGHSLSFGMADAVVILSPNTALADAVATAAGNLVKDPDQVGQAVDFAARIPGVTGALIICRDKMAAWGRLKLVPA